MAARTQRTASALTLAKLACQLVALTGTPIVNSTAYPLMEWLKLCVPFEVTSRNFWAAANVMVSKLSTLGTKVVNKEIDIKVDVSKYLPPRLGGTAIHPNYRLVYQQSKKQVDKHLVDLAHK